MNKIITHSDLETKTYGQKLAATLCGGDVVCLHGELGAGKTTLVKGIAEGLGVTENITSPTFTLMNVYEVPSSEFAVRRLVHIDTYRLEGEKELIEIGVEDYLGQTGTVTIVEWPEKIKNLLKNLKVVNVSVDHRSENSRQITIGD